jgi:hypothetical protein
MDHIRVVSTEKSKEFTQQTEACNAQNAIRFLVLTTNSGLLSLPYFPLEFSTLPYPVPHSFWPLDPKDQSRPALRRTNIQKRGLD